MRMTLLSLLISFLIVASAQPDWSLISCLLASTVGYALFWKASLKLRRRFWVALLWFGGVQAIHLSWFTSDKYVGTPILVFLALLCLTLGAAFAALTLCVRPPWKWRNLLALAGAWTLFEWGRLFVLSGFSWDPIALSLSASLYGMQLASVLGMFGLTYWVLLTNLLALKFFAQGGKFHATVWALFAATPYLFGVAHVHGHRGKMQRHAQPPHAIALVQTALYPEQKLPFPGTTAPPLPPQAQWRRLLQLIEPHKEKPLDLIVLSEGVVPYGTRFPIYRWGEIAKTFQETLGSHPDVNLPMDLPVGNADWAHHLADHLNAAVVAGFEDADETGAYNSAFFMRPGKKDALRYEKRVLVPMGEYIPFAWCRKFLAAYGIQDSFRPGSEAKVFPADFGDIGVSVCYEETYGHLMRESRQKGASLLVNITNDAWYPRSRLPMVHFLHGRVRAVEAGVPLVRACNTGVTCGVDSLGRTVAALPFETRQQPAAVDALHLYLSSYTYPTFYTLHGDKVIVLFSGFWVLVALGSSVFKIQIKSLLRLPVLRKNGR